MNAITQPDTFKGALTQFQGQISNVSQQLAASLPSHITIEKFQRTLMAAVKADPELLRADRASLINACEKAALDGLLPDKREAALVIFKRNYKDGAGNWQQALEVVYMPMVYGLRKKILQSGEVTDITAKVVYRREHEEGAFIYEEGTEAMLRHRPLMDLSEEDSKDENIVAVYSMATYKDGSKSYEVMRRFEIDRVRECSQTGATKDRYGKPRKSSGPWVDWYPEQCKKTAMRRHSKTLPMSGDLIIDVEGNELEISARSATRILEVEPDPVRILPSASDLDDDEDEDAAEAETIDQETGEVMERDERGMTEVDEETARRLDAGQVEDEAEEDPEAAGSDDTFLEDIRDAIIGARSLAAVNLAGAEWHKRRDGHDDDTIAEIDGLLSDAYKRVKEGKVASPADTPKEEGGAEEADPHAGQPYAQKRRELLDMIEASQTKAALNKANTEVEKHYAALPEKVQVELDTAITRKRRAV